MSMSNWLENEIIDSMFRARAYSIPAQLYVSLHSADPTDVSATAKGNELANGNAYARATPGASAYNIWKGTNAEVTAVDSAGTGGQTSNNAAITFPAATPAGWTAATHFGIWDASGWNADNFMFSGALGVSKTVQLNDVASFAAGAITVTFD